MPGVNDLNTSKARTGADSERITANAEVWKGNRRSFDSLRSLRMTRREGSLKREYHRKIGNYIPRGLKPGRFGRLCGTTEVVPFQNTSKLAVARLHGDIGNSIPLLPRLLHMLALTPAL